MKILEIDIETAPSIVYAWNLNKPYLSAEHIAAAGQTLCFAARWAGSNEMIFASVWKDGFLDMIHLVWSLLDEADAVVHYNGKKFDIPVLNKEFLLLNLSPPSPYHQIDLYTTIRSRFKFERNGLDYVCGRLGLGSKTQHKGLGLWKDVMAGHGPSQRKMEVYNKQDVRLLRKLYKKILPWIAGHPNFALYVDDNDPVCPQCGSKHIKKNGVEPLKTQAYQRFFCNNCKTNLRGRATILSLEKRRNILIASKL